MRVPKVSKNKGSSYIENEGYILRWPFSMIIVGKSGCGKTNRLLYMILSTKFFNKPDIIYYYGANIYQDDIQYLKEITDRISKKVGYNILVLEPDSNLIPDTAEYDYDSRKLVIFDDILNNVKMQDRIANYYINRRHRNISSIYLS